MIIPFLANMLDTLKLQLNDKDIEIFQPSWFFPHAHSLRNVRGFAKSVNNPTRTDFLQNKYMPRLTYLTRGGKRYLTIEFSAPKLIYGENLSEVEDTQFEDIIDILQSKVRSMGVNVTSVALKKAPVLALHPSKNIKLKDGYTSSYIISELSKVNIDKRLDLAKYRFVNGKGSSLQFHTKQHSFVIYDKVADLNAPKSKAIDKDKINFQRDLFSEIKETKKYFEVIRFEIRICARSKLKVILEKLGYVGPLEFQDLFKKELCQKILYYYWTKYFLTANLFLFDIESSPQKQLANIKTVYPDMKLKQIAYLLGVRQLCLDSGGIMGLRGLISTNEWQATKKSMTVLNEAVKGTYSFVEHINQELLDFNKFTYKIN